jgi:hypothetical protein
MPDERDEKNENRSTGRVPEKDYNLNDVMGMLEEIARKIEIVFGDHVLVRGEFKEFPTVVDRGEYDEAGDES